MQKLLQFDVFRFISPNSIQGSDGTGTHRNAVPVLFFGARNGVPVLFHDVEPFICYFLRSRSRYKVLAGTS